MEKIKNYLKLMRIKHYIKNFLIFFPLVFSKKLFEVSSLLNCVLAFAIFSLVCSIVYIVNDINDVEKDKLHPKKKNRPIASGKVSIIFTNSSSCRTSIFKCIYLYYGITCIIFSIKFRL